MLILEQYYIDKYNSFENGYNCCEFSFNPKYSHSQNYDLFNYENVIYVPCDIEFSKFALVSYCSISMCMTLDTNEEIFITPEMLAYTITKRIKNSRRFKDYLKEGIDELIKLKVINLIQKDSNNYIISKMDFLRENQDKFTIITYDELRKIFSIQGINNFLLLRYFIYLIGTLSSSIDVWLDVYQHKVRVVGNLTIDYISRLSGVSERSIIEYNKLLEKNGLLYIYRQNDFLINNKGEISQLPNVYGRPDNKLYIDTFAVNQTKHNNTYKYINQNLGKANNKRKLAQMYNQLLIGKGEYYTEGRF